MAGPALAGARTRGWPGVLPLVLHVAMAGPAAGADMLYALSRGGAGLHLDINIINMILVMLVAPGTALLLGVVPFARGSDNHEQRVSTSPSNT